ncbi:response regulator, partial [Thioclava sp. BHET1]
MDRVTGKILIVDAIATNRILLTGQLEAAFHRTLQASNVETALGLARQHLPALVLVDLNMPDAGAFSLCRALRSDPKCQSIPIVMTLQCATQDLPILRLAALRAGAEDLLPKPIEISSLLARFRSLVRLRNAEEEMQLREDTCRALGFAEAPRSFEGRVSIGLVGAQERRLGDWQAALSALPGTRCERFSPKRALSHDSSMDLFILDACAPEPGLQSSNLMSDLRSRSATRHAAVLIALPDDDPRATMALDLGATDLIPETATVEEIRLRVSRALARKALADRLRHALQDGLRLAASDPLTGLFNRRYALPH